jgi:biopolymer transport protein TolQ
MLDEATFTIKAVMVLLVAMSLGSWTIIVYKFIALSRARKQAVHDIKVFEEARTLSGAMKTLGQDSSSAVFRVSEHAVNEIRRLESANLDPRLKTRLAFNNARRSLRQAVSTELTRYSSSLHFLGTCANAAPFIGLFGTVWGIMRAFHDVSVMKTASLSAVAPGFAEALTTTAVGLIVAIPASMAYNLFMGMLAKIETELVNFAGSFLNRMQREIPWTAGDK